MRLPKRDGVNGRYYLIHKPDTDAEVLEHADQCIQDVLNGTAIDINNVLKSGLEEKVSPFHFL